MVNEDSTASELKVCFPREQPNENNGREKSVWSDFQFNRNSDSVTETPIKILPERLTPQDDKKLCTDRNLSILHCVYNFDH